MNYETLNYRNYLKSILIQKIESNPQFSMRAFGKLLGISHAALSQVFKGAKNLSYDRALDIATKLKLSEIEKEYFCTSVLLETVKSKETKHQLLEKLNLLKPLDKVYDLSVDLFKVIADWYHLPILSLAPMKNFDLTPAAVASQLGITTFEAEAAITRLLRLELLEISKTGKYKCAQNRLLSSSQTPNSALRKFHKQMLEKAINALEEQAPDEKITGSETFLFGKHKIQKAKEITEDYFNKMILLSQEGISNSKDVYHLQVNCFNLTHKGKL